MSAADLIDEVTDRLETAQRSATAIVADDSWPHFALDQAYSIQGRLVARRIERDDPLVGLKLGFTSEAKMRQMGVDELIVGQLTESMWLHEDDAVDLSALIHPRVEPEVAFLVGADVDLDDPDADIAASITGVCAAMEVIDSRYAGFSFDLPRVVADNPSAAAFALGPWVDPAEVDLADLPVTLSGDGEIRSEGTTSAILGHPLHTLERLVLLARRWDLRITAGTIILAGAATEAVPLLPGRTTVEVAHLGRVSIDAKGADS